MKVRRVPLIYEAVQFVGFENGIFSENTDWINKAVNEDKIITFLEESNELIIKTLEGNMVASKNDFIILGIEGELVPCKPKNFTRTYKEI